MNKHEIPKSNREPGSLSSKERDALGDALGQVGAVPVEEYTPPEQGRISDAAWRAAYEPPTPHGEPAHDGDVVMKERLRELVQLTQELTAERKKKENDPQSES